MLPGEGRGERRRLAGPPDGTGRLPGTRPFGPAGAGILVAWAPAGGPCTACAWRWTCATGVSAAPGRRRWWPPRPPSRASWANAPRRSPRWNPTGPVSSASENCRRCAALEGLSGLGLVVIDGYAEMDPGGRPGLGAHARGEFAVPVIGVAKPAFRTAAHAMPVLRGTSARPLFVTAAGMPRAEAAELVRLMAGRFRYPAHCAAPANSPALACRELPRPGISLTGRRPVRGKGGRGMASGSAGGGTVLVGF
jgi:hypothetical protein